MEGRSWRMPGRAMRFPALACVVLALWGAQGSVAQPQFQAVPAKQKKLQVGPQPDRRLVPVGVKIERGLSVALSRPGEVQSTVVPPGKKPECEAGRLLRPRSLRLTARPG